MMSILYVALIMIIGIAIFAIGFLAGSACARLLTKEYMYRLSVIRDSFFITIEDNVPDQKIHSLWNSFTSNLEAITTKTNKMEVIVDA